LLALWPKPQMAMARWWGCVLAAVLGGWLAGCGPAGDSVAQSGQAAPAGSVTKPLTVLVAGATGRTGRRVVAQLRERGHQVRAFVRDEQRARERLGEDLEFVVGDVREPDALASAFDGVDAVISAIGSSGRAKDPGNTPEAVDYMGVRNLVDGAAAAGVGRFVLVSSMGVTVAGHPLNQMFDDILQWKYKGEQHLRASGLPYTIIRPAGLTEDAGGAVGVKLMAEDEGEGFIPRADVATACIEALQHEAAANKTFSMLSDGDSPPGGDWAARFAAIPVDAAFP
jgi:uncharacterized protein YbjT (DUF2867 family)